MKSIKSSKQPKAAKPIVQVKDLKPKKNPKGGIKGGCDDWGCGSNHNETLVSDR